MGRASITTCGLCGIPLDGYLDGRYQRVADHNGLCVEVGYSLGGWGRRQDHIYKFSDEVCVPCYQAIMPAVEALKAALNERSPQRQRQSERPSLLQLARGRRV